MAADDNESGESSFARFEGYYSGYTTLDLIKALQKVRGQKDALDAELKDTAAEHDFLAKVKIPERFADEGIKNMSVEGIGRVSLTADIYASIKAGAKERVYQWLDDIGSGDLIQPTVPPSTLKAFVKGLIKKGEEYPEDLINVTPFQRASITKA